MVTRKAAEAEAVPALPSGTQFRFSFLVHDVSRMRRTMVDTYMRPLGVTRSQWLTIMTLARGSNTGMMQVELARLMEVGKVTVGGLVDRLEATGYVERRADTQDRRIKRVFITDKGVETLTRLVAVADTLNTRVLDGVSAEELAITERVLMRVKTNIRQVLAEDGTEAAEGEGAA